MNFAQSERAELCQLLDEVGADAPTLCEGWTTRDLAAHLWIRETDPLGAPGILAKPLAGLTERRMAEAKQRWSYAELVDRVRRGPAPLSVFAIPGLDEGTNTMEFFVHHEDVRRAAEQPAAPRTLPPEVEDWMWRRLRLMGRAFFRKSDVGVILERAEPADPEHLPPPKAAKTESSRTEPQTVRAAAGPQTVTLVGRPSELALYANGRGDHADVLTVGEPSALIKLGETELRI